MASLSSLSSLVVPTLLDFQNERNCILPSSVLLTECVQKDRLKKVIEWSRICSEKQDGDDEEKEDRPSKKQKKESSSSFSTLENAYFSRGVKGYTTAGLNTLEREVEYTRKPSGRFFSPVQNVKHEFRDFIFGYSSQLDVKNCHYSLAWGFLVLNIPESCDDLPYLREYALERDVVYARVFSQLQGNVELRLLKELFNSLLCGKSDNGIMKALQTDFVPLEFINLRYDIIKWCKLHLDKFQENPSFIENSYDACNYVHEQLLALESFHMLVLISALSEIERVVAWIFDAIEIMGSHEGDDENNEILEELRYDHAFHLFSSRPLLTSRGFYPEVKLQFKSKKESVSYCDGLTSNIKIGDESESFWNDLQRTPSTWLSEIKGVYPEVYKKMHNAIQLFRVTQPPLVYWKNSSNKWVEQKYSAFETAFQFVKCLVSREVTSGKGDEKVTETIWEPVTFAKIWFNHADGVFQSCGYFCDRSVVPPHVFNLYEGPEIAKIKLSSSDLSNPLYASHVQFILSHISFLCDGDELTVALVHRYIAHMFQHPGVKPRLLVLFRSLRQGTGKSQLVNLLVNMIGKSQAVCTSDMDAIFGKFNEMLSGKLFVGLDEAKLHKEEYLRRLKSLVTEDDVSITKKGIDTSSEISMTRFIGTTNDDLPVRLKEEEQERRIFAVNCTGDMLPTEKAIRLNNIKHKPKVLALLYKYWMEYPVPANYDFAVNRPSSQFYQDMMTESRSPEIESFIRSLSTKFLELRDEQTFSEEFSICEEMLYLQYKTYMENFYPAGSNFLPQAMKTFSGKIRRWLDIRDLSREHNLRGCRRMKSNNTMKFFFHRVTFKTWFEGKVNHDI